MTSDALKKPWDAFPPPNLFEGEADENAIYTAVGEALSSWERLEGVVSQVFATVVSAGLDDATALPALRAYGAVTGSFSRNEMVKAAANAALSHQPEVLSNLKGSLDEMNHFASRRNEIAHGVAARIRAMKGGGAITEAVRISKLLDTTWYLVPALYNTKKKPLLSNRLKIGSGEDAENSDLIQSALQDHLKSMFGLYKYNARQIRHYSEEFKRLKSEMADVRAEVAKVLREKRS